MSKDICTSCGIEADYQVDGLCACCLLDEGRDLIDQTVAWPRTVVDSYLQRHGYAEATQVNLAVAPGEAHSPSGNHPGRARREGRHGRYL
jgi:hypothetical protein